MFENNSYIHVQLLSKIFLDSDFCHNYLHTPYMFVRLWQTHSLLYVGLFSTVMIQYIYLLLVKKSGSLLHHFHLF